MKLFKRDMFKINKDFIMITLIIILPFVFYLYNLAPDTQTWENALFEIDSGAFEDVNYYLWYLSVKLLTVFIITFWYLSCTHLWRSILLISLISEIFKFFNLINISKFGFLAEDVRIIETLYFSVPYIIFLRIISKKLNYYNSYNNEVAPLNKEINSQIAKLTNFDKKKYKSVKKELKVLDAQEQNMDKKEYLAKLIELRDQLTIVD